VVIDDKSWQPWYNYYVETLLLALYMLNVHHTPLHKVQLSWDKNMTVWFGGKFSCSLVWGRVQEVPHQEATWENGTALTIYLKVQ